MSTELEQRTSFSGVIKAYGGWSKLLTSRYLWLSALLLAPTWGLWSSCGWWDVVLGVTPSLLGFTIGGFALLLAFGDDKFRGLLSRSGDPGESAMEELAATFLMFICVQAFGLLLAVCFKAIGTTSPPEFLMPMATLMAKAAPYFWGASFLVFLYGVVLSIAAARWIYMLACVYAQNLRDRHALEEAAKHNPVAPPGSPSNVERPAKN